MQTIFYAVTLLMFVVAGTILWQSVKEYNSINSASAYIDKGVRQFVPYNVSSILKDNPSSSSKDRRLHPKTVIYRVEYKAVDGTGLEYRQETGHVKDEAERILKEAVPVDRRVLLIKDSHSYITIDPDKTAESYVSDLRQKCKWMIILSSVFIVAYLAYCIVYCYRRNRC